MGESLTQPQRYNWRLTAGHHLGVAHITGMVAHIAAETDRETRRWRRNDGNEMTVKFTFFFD